MRNYWELKYEPSTIDDMIVNPGIKDSLEKTLDQRPNMFLYGPPGVGKGTYVNILRKKHDLKQHYMKINVAEEGSIDTVREKIKPFAMAFSGGKMKTIFMNEADHPSLSAMQRALKDLIETTRGNTQWIFACNYENLVDEAIKSRCEIYNLGSPPEKEIIMSMGKLLVAEKVKFNPKTLVSVVRRCYPDIRGTIKTLQQNVVGGKLKETVHLSSSDLVFDCIYKAMKSGDPENVFREIRSNAVHYEGLYKYLYDKIRKEEEVFTSDGNALLHIAEHAWRNQSVANKEINFVHMFFKMLSEGSL